MPETLIKAIHEDDLEALLLQIGFKPGDLSSLSCQNCGRSVRDDLGAIRRVDGRYVFSCGHAECLKRINDC